MCGRKQMRFGSVVKVVVLEERDVLVLHIYSVQSELNVSLICMVHDR